MRTGARAGCIRLVLTPRDRPLLPLPSEKVCAATIDRRLFDPAAFPRESIAEISRLALAPEFRRMRPERNKDPVVPTDIGTPTHPGALYLRLGRYLGAIALAHRLGIEALLFLTEPRLAAQLRKFGFPITQVGDPVEHRGTRVLSMAHLDDPIQRLPFYMRPLYRVVEREIEDGLEFGPVAAGFHHHAKRHARIGAGHPDAGAAARANVAKAAA